MPLTLMAYHWLGRLAPLILPALARRRAARGKEDPARLKERRGIASCAHPGGRIIWVHAASVGELNAVAAVILQLIEHDGTILLTSGTRTSARLARQRFGDDVIHQYIPYDCPRYVNRFLDFWKPSPAIFTESELWPAMIVALYDRNVPLVLVNGCLSARSFARWSRFRRTAQALLARLSLVLAQSHDHATRFRTLGARHLAVSGNLKFDADLPGIDPGSRQTMARAIGGRHCWLAASTHAGEEEAVIATHCTLVAEHPDLLTLIAPRHPQRRREIHDLCRQAGVCVGMRSEGLPQENHGIFIIDTIGELVLFYSTVEFAFIGGSLVARRGHNPIEPALQTCAIVHGPHVDTFSDIYQQLDEENGAYRVVSRGALTQAVRRLFADPGEASRLAGNAARIVRRNRGALEKTMGALAPYL